MVVKQKNYQHHYTNQFLATRLRYSGSSMHGRKSKLTGPGESHPTTPGSENLIQHLPSKLHISTGAWPPLYHVKSPA